VSEHDVGCGYCNPPLPEPTAVVPNLVWTATLGLEATVSLLSPH
jgi:hypothetical protein